MVVATSRRAFLVGAAALIAAPHLARAAPASRIVTLEWTATEIALSLGLRPVGVAERDAYRSWVAVDNEGLKDAVDVGRRQQPSLESIRRLSPDLILSSRFRHQSLQEKLGELAPTELLDDQPEDGDMLAAVYASVRQAGKALGREDAAAKLLSGFDARIAALKAKVPAHKAGRRVVVAQPLPGTARLRVFSSNAAVAQLLERIGFPAGLALPPQPFGFTAIDLEGLAALDGETTLILLSDSVPQELAESALWPMLPVVAAGEVITVGAANWPFGSIAALSRLMETVAGKLA